MEVGTQTDTLTNKNIVVIREPKKIGRKPRMKRNIRSISGATPDIQQQWRIWKGIDERNLLRNVEIDEDIVDKLTDVFGVKQSDVEKAIETFQKGRGKGTIGYQAYTKEQEDNRRVASRIGGDRISAFQGGLEGRRAYAGWENADWGMLERASMRSGRPLEEVFPFESINWGEGFAPRISMAEVEATQGVPQGGRFSRIRRQVDTGNILGNRLRETRERALANLGSMLRGSGGIAGRGVSSVGSSRLSGAQTALGSPARGPRYGISEGLRVGPRFGNV